VKSELQPAFVFFHVGMDIAEPSMLVASILLSNPSASITQCSDHETPAVAGITNLVRLEGNSDRLMTFRINAFSALHLDKPAIYLDTDMIVLSELSPEALSGGKEALLCQREFGLDLFHTGSMRDVSFPEHKGRPMAEVYPYLACATVTKDYTVWADLHNILNTLDNRFHIWYGDQEAMRLWVDRNSQNRDIGILPESKFACLPEEKEHLAGASILHFKGAARKSLMRELFLSLAHSQ